jgi:hypothetical protein
MDNIQQKLMPAPACRFVGPKCTCPIFVDHSLVHDFLIQASFDASINRIDFISKHSVAGQNILLDAIVVHRGGRAYAVDFPEVREIRDVDEEGLALIALFELGLDLFSILAADVELEPHCSNAREVWRHRNVVVPVAVSNAIIASIEARGALSLRELAKTIEPGYPVLSAINAIACAGLINLDLKQKRLGPSTIATRGYKRAEPAELTTKSLRGGHGVKV